MHRRALLLLLTSLCPFAPSSAVEPPRFAGGGTEVVSVEIPVHIVRDGKPVRGLSADDFEVWSDKEKLPITGFEVVDLAGATGASTPLAPLSPAARRSFLILFDLANSEPGAIDRAREAARRVVATLKPTDLVGVAIFTLGQGAQQILNFTTDRQQVDLALGTLGLPDLIERGGDPLALAIGEYDEASAGSVEDLREARIMAELKEIRDRTLAAESRREADRLVDTSKSIGELAARLAAVRGRKQVILLSEGFEGRTLLGTEDDRQRLEAAAHTEKGEIWRIDSDQRFGNTRAGGAFERMLEALRRADCVIQAVDIGGLRDSTDLAARHANGDEGLFAMADGTGGEFFRNWNDLGAAMSLVLERTSVTYVLAIQPAVDAPGTYHRLRVALKNPAGARVSHRAGFASPTPFSEIDPAARMLDAASTILAGRPGGELEASILALPFRGTSERAYVPVVVEIGGRSLLEGASEGVLPTEIFAYAIGSDGAIGDSFAQTLTLDLEKVGESLRTTPLSYVGHLELPAGDWSLRVLVRNGKNGRSALRVADLRIPTPDDARPVLVGPLLPRPFGETLAVRESPRGEQSDAPFPFQLEGLRYLPRIAPVIAQSESTRLVIPAWGLPAVDARARAIVEAEDGREAAGGKLKLTALEPMPGGGDLLVASFDPAGLAAGRYRLRVRLTLGELPAVETDAVSFEVR